MRVTYNFMTMKYLYGMNSTLNNLVKANEQVTSGRNLLNPEDDPTNYLSAFSLQRSVDDAKQYNRNGNNALVWLNNEDSVLSTVSDILSRAKDELAVEGANDSEDANSRKALAGEVKNIYEEMQDLANSKYMDRYIFGGYQTDDQPFNTGDRNVTAVMSNLDGGQAFSSRKYGDMPELKEGKYTMQAQAKNGVVYVTMKDENSKTVLLDSNGSDETTENGNLTSSSLTTEFKPGQVINTGRGVGIQLPDDMTDGQTLSLSFYYTPGDSVTYNGDDGEINAQIGSGQSVALNVSGQDIFMATNKTIQGTMSNTVNGVSLSETSLFSDIDGANVSDADSVTFTGTDHNGYKIGTARVTSPSNVDLDMTGSTDEQRTVTVTYGGKDYDLTMDESGYDDMDSVVFDLNRLLENKGLGSQVTAVNDGDKVMFMTTRAGDGVDLTVKGSDFNKLGFSKLPVSDTGEDTTFELGYDNYAGPVETVHDNLAIGAGNHTYYVNGEELDINVAGTDGAQEIQDKINSALENAGLGFDVVAKVEAGSTSDYKVTYQMVNQNYSKDTYLATRDDAGGANSYQYATAKGSDYPTVTTQKRVSDMLGFIENLYGNAVTASVEDGKIQVQDMRSGDSRLTFSMDEGNTGVGYAMLEPNVTLTGRYTGSGDDKWSVNVIASANVTLQVTDSKGNVIADNSANPINPATYDGEPIYLAQGVSIVLGQLNASTSFSSDMTAYSNLSFGDLNVTEDGSNVNLFQSLKNLYDALNNNIPDSGIAAPSAWQDTSLNSTATPYFDGTFRGNYNDVLNFEVENYDDKSEFYLQNEQSYESQALRSYDDADIDLNLMLKSDETTPPITLKNYTVSAGVYSGNTTLLLNNLVSQINSDSSLKALGVQATNDNGKLKIDSGSGNTEVSVEYNNTETAMVFGQTANSVTGSQLPHTDINDPSTLNFYVHTAAGWDTSNINVTVPAGNYGDTAGLLTEINNQLSTQLTAQGLNPSSITAYEATNGTISFNVSADADDLVVSGDENGELGFYKMEQANTVKADGPITTDVSEKTVDQRSLTFNYNDGSDKTASIVVDKDNYQSLDDLISNINQKLSDAGLTDITCTKIGEDSMGFEYGGSINSMHVSGDYEGTLGIEKGGDVAKMKVTSSDGTLINSYTIDTANNSYYVADGVYHHYDAGYLYATDSYTVAVGSGINYEMGQLEQAESQVHTAQTTVGNRVNRTESATSFNQSLITTNESLKSQFTESTTLDQTKAATNYTAAQTAYQAALSSTAKILQMSLLDYL